MGIKNNFIGKVLENLGQKVETIPRVNREGAKFSMRNASFVETQS